MKQLKLRDAPERADETRICPMCGWTCLWDSEHALWRCKSRWKHEYKIKELSAEQMRAWAFANPQDAFYEESSTV